MESSQQPCEKPEEPGENAPGPTDCVRALVIEEGESVVIYEENRTTDWFTYGTGWITSDTAVPLAAAR